MFILPAVLACSSLTPPAEISAIHFRARYQYASAACMEIPHPDHEAEGLTVNSVTGAPSEFSQVSQWTFVATWFPAIEKPGVSVFDFPQARKVQTRALSRTYWIPSKVRGR
jgi:hypothetical protein